MKFFYTEELVLNRRIFGLVDVTQNTNDATSQLQHEINMLLERLPQVSSKYQ